MKVFCILGDQRAYRLKSPEMFTGVLQRSGIRGAYVPFAVKPNDLGRAIQSLALLGIAGANVTVPYKERAIDYMDVLSEGANIIRAMNTVVITDNGLKGYNTNAIGFMDALNEAGYSVEGKSALIFGTGGAAKSVAFILNWLRTDRIYVAGRNEDKARRIVKRFGGEVISFARLAAEPLAVELMVNATAVSNPDESPQMHALTKELRLPDCQFVVDLNYGRQENFWQGLAQRLNARFMDGLSSLAFQARRTLALWTKVQIPPREFLAALKIN
jgi:shikimate dehydrogenase